MGNSNITPIPFQSEGKKMTVYSKQSYENQDDGRILKAKGNNNKIYVSCSHCLPQRRVKRRTWNEVEERGRII
jgi:magnesium-transporting ATPase (P-type)